MNLWLKRILLLSTLGGGFAGLAFTCQLIRPAFDHPANFVVVALFFAVFGLGIFSGWKLSEDERAGIRLAMWFFALQVPFVSSPFLGFGFIAGAGVRLGLGADGLIVSGRFGGEGWFSLLQGAKWGIAVNLVALVLFALCRRAHLLAEGSVAEVQPTAQQA